MADSSIVTLGAARSLLVDSSVCDSRIAETTRDHLFLGMACEDGQYTWIEHPLIFSLYLYIRKTNLLKKKNKLNTLYDFYF